MRVTINRETGSAIQIFRRDESSIKYDFPTESIFDWYPLSNAYQYRDSGKGYLELKRMRSSLPVSYGVSNNTTPLRQHESKRCNMDTWVNEAVQKENKMIMNKAKRYNIPTPDKPYTKNEIVKGFQDLGLLFTYLAKFIIEGYKNKLTNAELEAFNLKTEDAQLVEAFKKCDSEVEKTYDELGKIYNMLVLMKKLL